MTYPEPIPALSKISNHAGSSPTQALLNDESGLGLEIEFLSDIGWSIELRYDSQNPLFWRQPFTGAQERLARGHAKILASESEILISAGQNTCAVSRESGSFRLGLNGVDIFESHVIPFSSHTTPVTLFEQIMSRKVTDLTGRTFASPANLHFDTHMVRFQYPRPTGAVFGLAGQTGEFNRNGYRFELYNTDEFTHIPSRKPMYQSWPILFHRSTMGDGWVAVFHDNPARTFVDIGDFYEDLVTFESLSNNSRVYVCLGATLEEVSHKMSRLLGGMSLPPLWAFGYQQCRWSYLSTNEVRTVVQRMHDEQFPLDAIYFDIDYMDGYRVFTNSQKNFADFDQCVSDLHKSGVHAVAIVDPGVKIDPEYSVYRRVLESDAVLKNADNTPLLARVWPGSVVLPDFADTRMQNLWSDIQSDWLAGNKLDGIWNDMNEPSNFEGGNAATSRSMTARGAFLKETNLYGYYMAQTSSMGWKKAFPKKRGVIITRSGYPGVQQNAVIWHGDNQAWWEHMRLAIDTAVAYSISGAYYTGPDVPGFTGNPPDDLAVRFYQLGAFLPLFRGHSIFFAKDKEPYAFEPQTRELIRAAILLRYSLLREWYSGFEKSIREHRAPLMPVFDGDGSPVRDQFLLFDKLLVAPVIERDQKQKLIYLPSGTWFRLGETQTPIHGGDWISIPTGIETIPVYVKAGSNLTRNTPGKNAAETFNLPERQEIYPGHGGAENAQRDWYDDDGITP